ncbi:PAS domain S-box protein [Nocardioides KLBMP 9356]|uniref:histidine kinase n=1 Tax=Nocardioides potassii TaxID=2911371 RepID=A0ABS9HC49_9ACTN|nr:PAS domain S-box protein [Nocardioides potassii]MCF6377691.1 PAS domain S-box protein [Nocardioides potassii]
MVDTPRVSVVLVDDSTDVRTLVRMRLEASGAFDVVGEAEDGEGAIAMVVRHEPDLVLLDVSTPTMDGLETLPTILAVRPDTSVVMFTGFGGADLTAEVRGLGALDLIEKSIPLNQLADRLLRILRGGSGQDAQEGATATPREDRAVGSGPAVDLDLGAFEQRVLDEHVEGFQALFERAAIGMATLTVDATIVRANRALADLVASDPADLVGVDYGRLTGGQGDVLDHRLEVLRTSRANVATFEHPIPVPRGSARTRTASVTLVPIRDSSGQMLYVFAQVQDITAQRDAEDELRRSEQRFSLLVDAVEEYAIFSLDTDGVVMSWNAGARRIKGYEADQIVGRHFRVFYPDEEQRTGHPEHNLAVALRAGSFAEEGWRVRRDGTAFWASVVITAVRDRSGRHVGFAKITRDQTEQRRHADDRHEAMEEQARLLAVTAHELRTPTAVIEGSALVLQAPEEDLTPAERDQLVGGIRSSAERLRRLGADLAAASQLQRSGMEFRLEPVAIAELVWSTVARRATTSADVRVDVDDVPHGVVVRADEVRIGQALDNLVDNALRHGEAPVAVTAALLADLVEVRVTDAGPGAPREMAGRMFERFATGGRTSGTGLGLYLVREIARHHGGDVTYTPPRAGSPTTFTLTLPVDGVLDARAASIG